ncbi:GTPase IMAP family member 4-like isoform X1 [Salarias fasciatus]|uniref:GTPase IMAP family member 4-like isoform X1 n=1 Tax=Salarias fasciatus TaxID=181472 RepID=UPI001176E96E|nr:GTPase IMAP family member 4-like isoform X1 [Salarias fasciatus]
MAAELRLVVLGGTGTGTGKELVHTILGLRDPEQGEDGPPDQECTKHRGQAAGRQVALVSTPAWFSSSCPPEQRNRNISSFIALSSPGPHAFLLRVPLSRRADGEAAALDVLQQLLGPSAVSSHTVVLFTHMEELQPDEPLEEYLFTWRKDLLNLVGRCGDRYHTLEVEEGGERRAVEELLEKVEQVMAEPLSCPLYQEAERTLRGRQAEIARRRRGEGQEVTEEDLQAARDEAESGVGDLDINIQHLFPSASPPAAPAAPPFPWAWLQWLARLVRREALLGALVGLFVGGPFGGVVGASVGAVATEVQRRKSQKTK